MPLVGVALYEIIRWRAGRISDVSGIDEDADHHGNFFLRDQIVDNIESWIIAVAVNVSAAVLKYHQRRRYLRVVLCGHVNPVLALHAVINFADVDELWRECSSGNSSLQV